MLARLANHPWCAEISFLAHARVCVVAMDPLSVGGRGVSTISSRVSCVVFSWGVIFWTPRTHFGRSILFSKKHFHKNSFLLLLTKYLHKTIQRCPKVSKFVEVWEKAEEPRGGAWPKDFFHPGPHARPLARSAGTLRAWAL